MFKAKLLSVEVSANYVEPGDALIVTTRWQNIGDRPLDRRASITAQFCFAHIQRKSEERPESFTAVWEPYPCTMDWQPGEIIESAGAWTVPAMWGGTYTVRISLGDATGETVSFLAGADTAFCADALQIDVGWGWGRANLLRLRHPLSHEYATADEMSMQTERETFLWHGLLLDETLPSVCGAGGRTWRHYLPLIRERSIADGTVTESVPLPIEVQKDDEAVIYRLRGQDSTFSVCFRRVAEGFLVSAADVRSAEGTELLAVELPGLLQSIEDDATLISPYGGGRILPLAEAKAQNATFYYDACHFLAIGSKNGFFCADAADEPDAVLRQAVTVCGGERCATIGVTLALHIPAKRAGMRSILVRHRGVTVHYRQSGDWRTAAAIIRDRWSTKQLPKTYKDTLIYKIHGDTSAQYDPYNPATFSHKEIVTLARTEREISRIAALTDGMSQVVYLVGWQRGGHDHAYPEPYRFEINERLGTTQEYLSIAERLEKQNALLSFHDNFDDAYPAEDIPAPTELLAQNAWGKPYCGWLWAGGMAYTVDPKKYVTSGKAGERIRQTVEHYHIHRSYHLDVLSSEMHRCDFDPDALTDAREELAYKKEIVREFGRYGIDVTSETLAEPFIGVLGAAHSTRYNFTRHLFSGDRFVPLTTLAFHGAVPYGMTPGSDTDLLRAIAVGASTYGAVSLDEHDLERFYLMAIPMQHLCYKKAVDACWDGEKARVVYEDDSEVTVDLPAMDYRIRCEGEVIGESFTSFVPQGSKYLFYARNEGTYTRRIRQGWRAASVTVLTADGPGETTTVPIDDGTLTIRAAAGQPYVIREAGKEEAAQ